jgi:hypothetical protein
MKAVRKRLLIIMLLAFAGILSNTQAQPGGGPPPPPPNSSSGQTGPVGGSAPVGNGTLLLLTLALAYAGIKIQSLQKDPKE